MDPDVRATCEVALPIPAPTPYTYAIPPGLQDRVMRGVRVLVPVRSRQMIGIVVSVGTSTLDQSLREVLLVPESSPVLSDALIRLADWMSRYYVTPIGQALRVMVPGPMWGESKLVAVLRSDSQGKGLSDMVVRALQSRNGRAAVSTLSRAVRVPVWDVVQRLEREGTISLETLPARLGPEPKMESVVCLKTHLPSLMERQRVFGRAKRQREAYEALDQMAGEMLLSRFTNEFGFSRSVVDGLVTRGLAEIEHRRAVRDPFAGTGVPLPGDPSPDQAAAIEAIRSTRAGQATTLFGVTGSGKTLVYLNAIMPEVTRGRGAIVLVPEIALTPQTVDRVRGVFGDSVAVIHSGLSEGERADAWRGVASGQCRVVVGARSAVFAPVVGLSTIIVDEEHDASYKNGETPRYHARDVAQQRAKFEGARVVLGSATPSLETWHARDNIPVIRLPERVTARPLPRVELIDLKTSARIEDSAGVPWSARLDAAVRDRLDRRQQVILLLNRRGLAHFLQCASCGMVPECVSCSLALTVHATPSSLRCHYCGFERTVPETCELCGGKTQRTRGVGTQSLERWLGVRYPDARLARMDADTTSTKWSHARILTEFAQGAIDILFGTQMIAKGLDFPNVTLVGVVNADTNIHLPDFRAAERTFQLIAQVAGRAGRGPLGGEVLVQTRVPDHYALQATVKHDFEGFALRELDERTEPLYPPHVALVNVLVSGVRDVEVSQAAMDLADWFRGLAAAKGLSLDVLGPAPAALAKVKDRWRWHLLLRATEGKILGRVLRFATDRAPHMRSRAVRVILDRDPVSLL